MGTSCSRGLVWWWCRLTRSLEFRCRGPGCPSDVRPRMARTARFPRPPPCDTPQPALGVWACPRHRSRLRTPRPSPCPFFDSYTSSANFSQILQHCMATSTPSTVDHPTSGHLGLGRSSRPPAPSSAPRRSWRGGSCRCGWAPEASPQQREGAGFAGTPSPSGRGVAIGTDAKRGKKLEVPARPGRGVYHRTALLRYSPRPKACEDTLNSGGKWRACAL